MLGTLALILGNKCFKGKLKIRIVISEKEYICQEGLLVVKGPKFITRVEQPLLMRPLTLTAFQGKVID